MALLISKYWNPVNLLSIWKGVRDSNYAKQLSAFMPYKRTVEEKIRSIKGYKDTNVILNLCDPDSKATIRGSRKLSFQDYEIPEFREGIQIYASELREINRYLEEYGTSPESLSVLDNKYKDYLELMNGVPTNAEYFRAQLLQYGKFRFNNRTDDGTFGMVEANFDSDGEWADHNVVDALSDWSDPAADALGDIERLVDAYQLANDGEAAGVLVMNQVTWNRLKKNESLNEWMFNMRVRDPKQYFTDLGLSIKIDNQSFQRQVGYKHNAQEKFIEDGNVCLIPNTRLGNIVCAESDLFRGMARAGACRPDVDYDDQTGTVVRTIEETDPDKIKTTIEVHMFPQFDQGMFERCCVLHPLHSDTRIVNKSTVTINADEVNVNP